VASPSLSAPSSTVSASLSSLSDPALGPPPSSAAAARDAAEVGFELFLALLKMDPTGFLGSGSANEAFLLGMMMGPSSVLDSSDAESASLSRRPESLDILRRWMAPGLGSSTTTVVSARARPLESIVNLTDVRVRGPPDSGIDVRLDRR
jgi:hypothetical protein